MASYTKPDERLSETDLLPIVNAAVPAYAYHGSPREWTWTRPGDHRPDDPVSIKEPAA